MDGFKNRSRMSFEDAKRIIDEDGTYFAHLLDNSDGTYSVMSHINCEHCDYCEEKDSWYKAGIRDNELKYKSHLAKADPYENQRKKFPENY